MRTVMLSTLVLLGASCLWPVQGAVANDATDLDEERGISHFHARKPMSTTDCPDEISRLRCEIYNSALLGFKSRHALYQGGKTTLNDTLAAAQRLMESELALVGDGVPAAELFSAYLRLAGDISDHSQERFEVGNIAVCDRELARHWYLSVKLEAASFRSEARAQAEARAEHSTKARLLELDVRQAALELHHAEAELAEDHATNRRSPGSITPEQMRRKELQVALKRIKVERAELMRQHRPENVHRRR